MFTTLIEVSYSDETYLKCSRHLLKSLVLVKTYIKCSHRLSLLLQYELKFLLIFLLGRNYNKYRQYSERYIIKICVVIINCSYPLYNNDYA